MAWSPSEVATLRHLADSGFTARYISRKLGRSPDSLSEKARQLRVTIRRPGKIGLEPWLTSQIKLLDRRAKSLKLRAASAKSKQAAETLARSAEESSRKFERMKDFLRKYRRYIGVLAQKLEIQLLKIKQHLQDVEAQIRKKKGSWWKISLSTVKDVVSILNGLLTIVTWVMKTFAIPSLVA